MYLSYYEEHDLGKVKTIVKVSEGEVLVSVILDHRLHMECYRCLLLHFDTSFSSFHFDLNSIIIPFVNFNCFYLTIIAHQI